MLYNFGQVPLLLWVHTFIHLRKGEDGGQQSLKSLTLTLCFQGSSFRDCTMPYHHLGLLCG